MSVRNLTEFEAALNSEDPVELEAAWQFFKRVEEKFRYDIIKKRLKILKVALGICPSGVTIPFFGSREEIQEKIVIYQKELPEKPAEKEESGE